MAADRQDIDALLIGALYGELDGDERTRLEAHLASHPQDRSALDGLRATRAMLREADLPATFASVEPSPAISARLIQEAARRAPVKSGAGGGVLGFLAGLLRPFSASPALAAATALVLVGGAAGVMYARGTFQATEPTVAHTANDDRGVAVATAPAIGAAGSGSAAGSAQIDDYRVALDEAQAPGAAPAVNGFADGLTASETDNNDQDRRANEQTAAKLGATGKADAFARQATSDKAESFGFESDGKTKPANPAKKMAGTASTAVGGKGAATPDYIEISKQDKDAPTVLDVDGDRYESDTTLAQKEGARPESVARGAGATRAPTDRAPAPAPAAPPPPAAQAPATKPQVARDQRKTSGSYDPAAAAALDAWARDQHARMVKLVSAGKCTDAGAIGADIARKAPDYYQANVANDRQVRSCRSYVDRARRTKSDDAKSKAAAPRAPSPDAQQDLENVK